MALSATPVTYIEDDIRKKLTWSVLYNKLKDQYNNYSVSIFRKIRWDKLAPAGCLLPVFVQLELNVFS